MGQVAIVVEDPAGGGVRGPCRRVLQGLLQETGHSAASVELLLAPDRTVRALNRRHHRVDRVTDVLAFPSAGDLEPGHPHLGEIAVSVPRATRQAKRAGWPLRCEMALLVTHGFLHLLGYDHETDDGTMRRLEEELLRRVARVRIARRALPWGDSHVPRQRRRGGARRTRS